MSMATIYSIGGVNAQNQAQRWAGFIDACGEVVANLMGAGQDQSVLTNISGADYIIVDRVEFNQRGKAAAKNDILNRLSQTLGFRVNDDAMNILASNIDAIYNRSDTDDLREVIRKLIISANQLEDSDFIEGELLLKYKPMVDSLDKNYEAVINGCILYKSCMAANCSGELHSASTMTRANMEFFNHYLPLVYKGISPSGLKEGFVNKLAFYFSRFNQDGTVDINVYKDLYNLWMSRDQDTPRNFSASEATADKSTLNSLMFLAGCYNNMLRYNDYLVSEMEYCSREEYKKTDIYRTHDYQNGLSGAGVMSEFNLHMLNYINGHSNVSAYFIPITNSAGQTKLSCIMPVNAALTCGTHEICHVGSYHTQTIITEKSNGVYAQTCEKLGLQVIRTTSSVNGMETITTGTLMNEVYTQYLTLIASQDQAYKNYYESVICSNQFYSYYDHYVRLMQPYLDAHRESLSNAYRGSDPNFEADLEQTGYKDVERLAEQLFTYDRQCGFCIGKVLKILSEAEGVNIMARRAFIKKAARDAGLGNVIDEYADDINKLQQAVNKAAKRSTETKNGEVKE